MPRVTLPVGDMVGVRAIALKRLASSLSKCHWSPPAFLGLKIRQEVLFHKTCHPFLPPCLGWVGTEPRYLADIALHGLAQLSSRASSETQVWCPTLHSPGALPSSGAPWGVVFTSKMTLPGLTHW